MEIHQARTALHERLGLLFVLAVQRINRLAGVNGERREVMATVEVECNCCQGGRRPFRTGGGKRVPCPYCQDTGRRSKTVPDASHRMTKWRTEVRCPESTLRFYGVRNCSKCGEEEWSYPAGHFLNGLARACKG